MLSMDTSVRLGGGLNVSVAAEVRAELARRRWSQAELAQRLGVDQMWLSRRLRGTKPLSLSEFEAIARALEITPTELLERAVRLTVKTTEEYSTLSIRAMSGRPPGGQQAHIVSGPPNVAAAVRRSRVTGAPLAVADLPRVA